MPAVPDTQAQVAEAKKAAEEAAEAARRAEKAAKRPTYWLIAGFSFALVGAVLAFALEESDPSVLGVSLRPFGGVLFGAGVLLIVAAAVGSAGKLGGHGGDGCGGGAGSNTSLGGLIAVVAGIAAVTALTIVTLTQLGTDEENSIVAVTTSAFGIISAVIGAYLGIKISSETAAKATTQAKDAAVAQHVARVTSSELEAVKDEAAPFLNDDQKAKVREARIAAGEETAKADLS